MTGRGTSGTNPADLFREKQKCPRTPNKKPFFTLEAAWTQADKTSAEMRAKRTKGEVVPYLCDACGHYHMTADLTGEAVIDRKGRTKAMRRLEEQNNVIELPKRVELPVEEPPASEESDLEKYGPIIWSPESRRNDFKRRNLESVTAKEYAEYYNLNNVQAARQDLKKLGWKIDSKGMHARYWPPTERPKDYMSAADILRHKREQEGRTLHEVPESEINPASPLHLVPPQPRGMGDVEFTTVVEEGMPDKQIAFVSEDAIERPIGPKFHESIMEDSAEFCLECRTFGPVNFECGHPDMHIISKDMNVRDETRIKHMFVGTALHDAEPGESVTIQLTDQPPSIPHDFGGIEHLTLRDVAAVLHHFGFDLAMKAEPRER